MNSSTSTTEIRKIVSLNLTQLAAPALANSLQLSRRVIWKVSWYFARYGDIFMKHVDADAEIVVKFIYATPE